MGLAAIGRSFENLSIRQKVLYSTIVMFLLLGSLSSVAYWLIFIPTFVDQIQQHGKQVAYSLVARSRSYILTHNRPELTFMLFQKKGIETDLSYIFITDPANQILAHTFVNAIPEAIAGAHTLGEDEKEGIRLIEVGGKSVYDQAVAIKEGLKTIGIVHIGLDKQPVDALTTKIGLILLAVMGVIVILAALLSNLIATYISMPLSKLVRAMNDLCVGVIERLPQPSETPKCWEVLNCRQEKCPAYHRRDLTCWFVDGTFCHGTAMSTAAEKLGKCYQCKAYRKLTNNEITQLSSSFNQFILTLQLKTQEIKASEEKYELLFNYDPNPLFLIDMPHGRVLDLNDPAMAMYGWDKEDLVGASFVRLFHKEDGLSFLKAAGETTQAYFFFPMARAVNRDGRSFIVEIHARSPQFQNAGLPFLIVSTVDITARLEQEAQLIQAGKMAILGEMATGIAHELNQPLSVIRMGADFFLKMLARKEKASDEDVERVCRNISAQVERASSIINHLRDFGRRAQPVLEEVDINQPIREVFGLVGEQLRLREIGVDLDLQEDLPPIMADSNRLEQIFLNLVSNARDAMETLGPDQEKRLIIKTRAKGGHVVATVSDTGKGMSKQVLEKSFEPFFTTKEIGKGTGLGLSITYNLVSKFDGAIKAASEPGAGTIFTLSFPIHSQEESRGKAVVNR